MSKKKRKKKKQHEGVAASSPPAAAAPTTLEASPSGRQKLEQKIERLEQKLEDKKRAAFESTPGEDDASIPPVVEDEFFKKGDEPPPRVSAGMSGAFDAVPDPRSQRKLSPEARARRAQLAKWVKGAVAVSAAIIAIGVLRVTLKRQTNEEPVKAAAAVMAPVAETKIDPPVQPAQTQEQVAPPPVDDKKEEAKVDEPKVDDKADPKEQAKDEPKEKPALTAAQEKAQAQRMLDANNAGGAAAAAGRSVALDPHDAEAWLILGAAYQMSGSNTAAKQAFSNCTKQAKRGPVSECASMMNQ